MGFYFRLHPKVTLHLFDNLIKPILLYNSDFWGCLKLPNNNPIENTHMRFCKDLLGVQRQTSNFGVLLEMGRVPIMIYGKKNAIKNWARIHIEGKANQIVLWTHLNSIDNQLKWSESVSECLNRMGIGGEHTNKFVDKSAFQRMTDIFHQEAFAEINRDKSKLRTYAKIKQEQGMENYLNIVRNVDRRTHLSKLRLSNHDLMIEKGRHQGLEINQRKCPFCPTNTLEDESHFLLSCKVFTFLRDILLGKRYKYFPTLSDTNIVNYTGIYLQKAMELRRFILSKHKNTD